MSRWALERSLFWRAWRGEEGVVAWRVLRTRCCTERRGSPLPGWRIYRHLIPGAVSIVLLELRWFVGLDVPWALDLRAHSWTRRAIHSLPLYTHTVARCRDDPIMFWQLLGITHTYQLRILHNVYNVWHVVQSSSIILTSLSSEGVLYHFSNNMVWIL